VSDAKTEKPAGYEPPKVWKWESESGGRFAKINRPIAGPTHEKDLPVGEHPLQLYSLATPNGVKVTVMLEELLALGKTDAEYDAWLINIGEGDQFSSGFVAVNPNSKIPALLDRGTDPATRVFESGAILVYLAESVSPGCSGRWAAPPISAAASATSTRTRRSGGSTRSTATPWRSSGSSTSSIATSPTANS